MAMTRTWLMTVSSYEALPPNFSILENCFAGAFAGIAVWTLSVATLSGTDQGAGTLGYVSS